MKKSIDIQRIKVYLWLALAYFVLWLMYDYHVGKDEIFLRFINNVWRLIYVVGINFVFIEFIFPYARRKRRFLIYNILLWLLAIWSVLMLLSFGLFAWRQVGVGLHIYTPLKTFLTTQEGVSYGAGYGIFSLLFFGILVHLYDFQKLKASAKQLLIEKQTAELSYLKSQTNPHFLFNTLNNIYSLSRDKSDLAPASILQLSKILRYMLYEAGGDYVAIEQELKIINDYIALEQLRYDETLRVNFNHDVDNLKQSLPPLLLMPLVENAFKHGVSETRSHPFVDIHLSIHERQLSFLVRNSTEPGIVEEAVKENIGLSNLRRQLELLYGDYKLNVQQTDSVFTASLKINLASHVKNQMYHSRR